jgi:hypothetical protein
LLPAQKAVRAFAPFAQAGCGFLASALRGAERNLRYFGGMPENLMLGSDQKSQTPLWRESGFFFCCPEKRVRRLS